MTNPLVSIPAKENPGATATATGANIKSEAAIPHQEGTPETTVDATFYWDRGPGPVEPLRNLSGVLE